MCVCVCLFVYHLIDTFYINSRHYIQDTHTHTHTHTHNYIYIYIYALLRVCERVYEIESLADLDIYIFTNPSTQAGYDTRSIFKRSLTGLNSDFSFSTMPFQD